MRLPRDRIIDWQAIDAIQAQTMDRTSTPEQQHHLEQVYLIHLLLRDERGRVTLEQLDLDAPRLLELGTVVVRPFDQNPSKARVSFRPASPALAAIRPTRPGRPKEIRSRCRKRRRVVLGHPHRGGCFDRL
jgi:hypothetical protein